MQPIYLIGLGASLSLIALGFIFFSDPSIDNISEKELQTIQSSIKEGTQNNINITYSHNTSSAKITKVSSAKPIEKEIKKNKKVDNTIKFITHDQKKKYTMYLIDENEIPLKNPKKKTAFSGKIDGSSFAMRIPQELLHENLSIKVKNNKTGEVKTVPIPFLADIQPGKFLPKVEMDFANIDNYNVVFPTAETMDFPGQSIYD